MTISAIQPVETAHRLDVAPTHRFPTYLAVLALAAFTLIVDGVPIPSVARILSLTEDATADLYFDHVSAEITEGRIPTQATKEDRQTVRDHLLPTFSGWHAAELAAELACGDSTVVESR